MNGLERIIVSRQWLGEAGGRCCPVMVVLLLAMVLSACGGGASTEALPDTSSTQAVSYNGPAPATADVQSFKLNVWDKLKASNRCGSCHDVGGAGSPAFVRTDDINLAYAAVNPLVDLVSPGDSRLVTKVAGGHHCWLAATSACGAVMTAYIQSWASGTGTAPSKRVEQITPEGLPSAP